MNKASIIIRIFIWVNADLQLLEKQSTYSLTDFYPKGILGGKRKQVVNRILFFFAKIKKSTQKCSNI